MSPFGFPPPFWIPPYDAFEYRSTPGLIDLVLGAETSQPRTISDQILEASVPQAMYYASWNPWIP